MNLHFAVGGGGGARENYPLLVTKVFFVKWVIEKLLIIIEHSTNIFVGNKINLRGISVST